MLAALLLVAAQAAPAAGVPGRTDPAVAIRASLACRDMPPAINEARGYLVAQGWPDVTRPSAISDDPGSYQFDRDGIWLNLQPFNASLAECATHAHVPDGTALPSLLPALAAALGRAPDSTTGERAFWNDVAGRKVEVALIDGQWLNIFFRPARAAPTPDRRAEAQAPDAPSSAPSAGADEIANAAVACVAATAGARVDAAAIRAAGWSRTEERGGTTILSRKGSNVRLFASPMGQCVVDAYGERRDSFESIRHAVGARLTERFGTAASMISTTGDAQSLSRGQGFKVGDRLGVLSSEQRDEGLSIRFTVMSLSQGSGRP